MKATLENSVKTKATPEDLKVVQVIIHQFTMFDSYYGKFTRLHAELRYKEYSTLRNDFKCFLSHIVFDGGVFSIRELVSLKRSIGMLRDRMFYFSDFNNQEFFNFLEETFDNLENWTNEVLEAITSDER